MVRLVFSRGPAVHLIAGDVAYATPKPLKLCDTTGYFPGQWDKYLAIARRGPADSVASGGRRGRDRAP